MNMKEENKGTPKNAWSRLYRKKWFFPAVYLGAAALLLTLVIWFQGGNKQQPEAEGDLYKPNEHNQEAVPVVDQDEVIKMPVKDGAQMEVATKFYDYDADQKDRLAALVYHNSRYYQSTGIDLVAENGETFEVLAALSGTVSEVKEDPLLGNVVSLDHGNDVMTYYASLADVDVKVGEKIKQGDVLGTAGKNLFGKDHGNHVHFELRKNDKEVNPELYFNQPVSKLDEVVKKDEGENPVDADENGDNPADENEDNPTDEDKADETPETEDTDHDETNQTDKEEKQDQ
ncbi:MAG TPA: M23 family metallopeptidase [Cerasibacillus sp.]